MNGTDGIVLPPNNSNSIFPSAGDDIFPKSAPSLPPSAPPTNQDKQGGYSSDSDGGDHFDMSMPDPVDEPPLPEKPEPAAQQPPKRKKFDIKDVFNQDDEDMPVKKRRLPLPGKDRTSSGAGKEKGGEDKRKNIKNLIDRIPTTKAELFAYPIDSSLVNNVLMEKRIRPWISKKIVEYIGEPEPTLVDFICSKVLLGSEPESLLSDVQMVLDDEAEVFVVKMWRLLIYEIESQKQGLGKS